MAWDDSRDWTVESQTQDIYFTRMRLSAEGILTAQSEPSWADTVTWSRVLKAFIPAEIVESLDIDRGAGRRVNLSAHGTYQSPVYVVN